MQSLNRKWTLGLSFSVLCVLIAVGGIVLVQTRPLSRPWAYGFLVLGLLGAATAMLQTLARAKAGDDIDEAKL